MALVVEDGTGKADANSFLTVAEGDALAAAHLYPEPWNTADPARKAIAAQMATSVIERTIAYYGERATTTQALGFPRRYVPSYTRDTVQYYFASDAIPPELKAATFEVARLLLEKDRTKESDTKGIKDFSAGQGAIAVTFSAEDRAGILTDNVMLMLQPFGVSNEYSSPFRELRRA
jgi:hypothetical protein